MRNADRLFACLPLPGFPCIRCVARPLCAPMSDPLLTPFIVSCGDDVVSNVELNGERDARSFFDPDDLELRSFHLRDLSEPGVNLFEKSLASEHDMSCKLTPRTINALSCAQRGFLLGSQWRRLARR